MSMPQTHAHQKGNKFFPSKNLGSKSKIEYLEAKWRNDVRIKERANVINYRRQLENLEKQADKKLKLDMKKKFFEKYYSFIDHAVESQAWGVPIVHKVGSHTLDFVNQFKDQVLDCFNEHFGSSVRTFEGIGTSIGNTLEAITHAATRLLWFVPIFAGIIYLGKKGLSPLAKVLLLALSTLPFFDKVSKLITNFLDGNDIDGNNTSDPPDEPLAESQSGFHLNIDVMRKVFTSLTATVLGLKGASQVISMFNEGTGVGPDLYNTVKSAAEGAFKASRMTDFVKASMEVCEGFLNYLMRLCGKDKKFSFFKSGQREVDTFVDAVRDLATEYSVSSRPMDVDSVHLLHALQSEGTALHKVHKNNPDVSRVLDKALRDLNLLCAMNRAALAAALNARVQPVCIMLTGNSGIGKSLFAKCLCSQVLAEVLPSARITALKGNCSAEIWPAPVGEKWYDGYVGQAAAVMDDCFMPKTQPGDDGDQCVDLIRMVNAWAFPLPMATLERKGNQFFSSMLVLGTTNQSNLMERAAHTVYNPAAVVRRIEFGYKVGVNDEFRKHGKDKYAEDCLNVEKVFEYVNEHKKIPTHAWVFAKHNFATGVTHAHDTKTFDQVVRDLVNSIKRNQDAHRILDDADRLTFKEKVLARFPDLKLIQDGGYEVPEEDGELCQSEGLFGGETTVFKYDWGYPYKKALEAGLLSHTGKKWYQTKGMFLKSEYKVKGPIWNKRLVHVRSHICKAIFTTNGEIRRTTCDIEHKIDESILSMRREERPTYYPELEGNTIDEEFEYDSSLSFEQFDVIVRTREIAGRLCNNIDSLRESLYSALFNEESFMAKNPILQYLLGFGGFLVMVRLFKNVVGTLISKLFGEKELCSQSMSFGEAAIAGVKLGTRVGVPLSDTVAKNLYSMTWHLDTDIRVGQVFMLIGGVAMVPTHFFCQMSKKISEEPANGEAMITLKHTTNSNLVVKMSANEFLSFSRVAIADKDCSLVDVKENFHVKDFVGKFVTNNDVKELRKYTRFPSTLVLSGGGPTASMITKETDSTQFRERLHVTVTNDYNVVGCWQSNLSTNPGECGAPLVTGPTIKHFQGRCILGFHTGALLNGSAAFSSCVTQEMVLAAIQDLQRETGKCYVREKDIDPKLVASQSYDLPEAISNTTSVGICTTNVPVNLSPNTGYLKSCLFEMWGPATKEPAVLTPDALANAFGKYGGPVILLPEKEIEEAAHTAYRIVSESTRNESRRILSIREAICGVPGDKYIKSVNRLSGAGWPDCESKVKYFGNGDTFCLDNPNAKALIQEVEDIITDASKGVRNFHACQTIYKREKVKPGKLRLVFGTPISYMLAVRMYFQSFIAAVSKNRMDTGCCLGINPYKEWGDLAEKLIINSDHVVAGDYKSFDASAQQRVYRFVLDIINKWYDDGEENALIRKVLWMDLLHSRHVMGDHYRMDGVVQWFKSLPSGHPMTTTANNLYNMVIFIMTFNRAVPQAMRGTFEEHVVAFFFGDDNISSVKEKVLAYFNQMTIPKIMADLGMVYTTEDKGEAERESRSLFECGFLKRDFVQEIVTDSEGNKTKMFLAALAKSSFLESPYWVTAGSASKVSSSDYILRDGVETLLMELSAHGDDAWDEYYTRVAKSAKDKLDYVVKGSSRDFYLRRFINHEPTWDY